MQSVRVLSHKRKERNFFGVGGVRNSEIQVTQSCSKNFESEE
jgi:hypothetical protein